MANKKLSELSVKLDVDVSEALTGLKAIQREAKKATQAIKEFATVLDNNEELVTPILSAFSNDDLIEALKTRGYEVTLKREKDDE